MDLNELFESSGIDLQDDAALNRKEELDKKSYYLRESKEDSMNLRDRAVKMGLIPRIYRDASFDKEKIKDNISRQDRASGHRFKVIKFEDYYNVCSHIINMISANTIPNKSYLIGAPNGFGKQSFAIDCILASLRNGWNTVPYISLLELAEIKKLNDDRLVRSLRGLETPLAKREIKAKDTNNNDFDYSFYAYGDRYTDIKLPAVVTGQYSWSEYINAPVLICFFSGVESRVVESQILNTLLNIRAAKGFPTIATISTSLDLYTRDPGIGRYIWGEILGYDDGKDWDLGRVHHISTFKRERNLLN